MAARAWETEPSVAADGRRCDDVGARSRGARAMGPAPGPLRRAGQDPSPAPVTAAAVKLVRLAARASDTPAAGCERSAFAWLINEPAAPARGVRRQPPRRGRITWTLTGGAGDADACLAAA